MARRRLTDFERFEVENGTPGAAALLDAFGDAATCWPEYQAWIGDSTPDAEADPGTSGEPKA